MTGHCLNLGQSNGTAHGKWKMANKQIENGEKVAGEGKVDCLRKNKNYCTGSGGKKAASV